MKLYVDKTRDGTLVLTADIASPIFDMVFTFGAMFSEDPDYQPQAEFAERLAARWNAAEDADGR